MPAVALPATVIDLDPQARVVDDLEPRGMRTCIVQRGAQRIRDPRRRVRLKIC
jgi:hypothetical protein